MTNTWSSTGRLTDNNILGCGEVVNQIINEGTAAHTMIVRIINHTAVIFSTIVDPFLIGYIKFKD